MDGLFDINGLFHWFKNFWSSSSYVVFVFLSFYWLVISDSIQRFTHSDLLLQWSQQHTAQNCCQPVILLCTLEPWGVGWDEWDITIWSQWFYGQFILGPTARMCKHGLSWCAPFSPRIFLQDFTQHSSAVWYRWSQIKTGTKNLYLSTCTPTLSLLDWIKT